MAISMKRDTALAVIDTEVGVEVVLVKNLKNL
jgi:hypothetical protein